MSIKIAPLIDIKEGKSYSLRGKQGFSLYIEFEEKKVLFDIGQGVDYIENAERLNIDIKNLDYVILSQGDYSNIVGLRKLIEISNKPFELIVWNGSFNKKYKLSDEDCKCDRNLLNDGFILKRNIAIKYITEDILKIREDLIIFSNFPESTKFEILDEKSLIKKRDNTISDEIVLGIKYEKGLVVILGSQHVGVVNILETIIKRTGMPIYCVIGGSNLIEADELRLNDTMNFLNENNISILRLSNNQDEDVIGKEIDELKYEIFYNNSGNLIEII